MQVQKMGVRITDVPGVESITVEAKEGSEGGVHVAVKYIFGEHPLGLDIRELTEHIEALTAALTAANEMAAYREDGRWVAWTGDYAGPATNQEYAPFTAVR